MTAEPQAIAMIGAGAMGGSFAAVLAKAGHRLTLIDTDAAHADVIRRDGLVVESAIGRISVNVPIAPDITAPGTADLAVVFVTSRDTVAAAPMVAKALKPGAPALTLQNGIGNVEALQAVLGRDRVLAGSTKCSAARPEPGRPR